MSNGQGRPATAPGLGESFEAVIVPHLDAAHRLARWLMRDERDAEDAVQEGVPASLSILPDIRRGRQACVVPQNRAQHLLQLAARRSRRAERPVR
jgi:hypothetical protein